jgi:hypothetical protein
MRWLRDFDTTISRIENLQRTGVEQGSRKFSSTARSTHWMKACRLRLGPLFRGGSWWSSVSAAWPMDARRMSRKRNTQISIALRHLVDSVELPRRRCRLTTRGSWSEVKLARQYKLRTILRWLPLDSGVRHGPSSQNLRRVVSGYDCILPCILP